MTLLHRRSRMTVLLADRFLDDGRRWIDVATGAPVLVHLSRAGTPVEQLAWTHRCETLANLRHTVLRPLLDFGFVARETAFEAYAAAPPLRAGSRTAGDLRRHASRFLASRLGAGAIDRWVCRDVVSGPALPERPLAYELQRRSAYDALLDALDAARPAGVSRLVVAGPRGSGLRTLRLQIARAARLAGYVPLGVESLPEYPELAGAAWDRHLCVLAGPAPTPPEVIQRVLARAGSASARRQLVIEFARGDAHGALRLEPMGVTAMTAMVYAEGPHGPAVEEILRSARTSAGWPGRFLAGLCGTRDGGAMLVREAAAAYIAATAPARSPAFSTGRLARVLERSRGRGVRLARAGRHAAACRVLERAARLLRARGFADPAAECALARGDVLLDRGASVAARAAFDDAREIAESGRLRVSAAIGVGRARLLESRFQEAEAAFRTAVTAATTGVEYQELAGEGAAMLAECLCRQGRVDEAEVALAAVPDGGAAAAVECARASVHLARNRIADAGRAAQRAVECARTAGDPRTLSAAYAALARAHHVAGNAVAARQAIEEGTLVARRAHLPVARLSLGVAALGAGLAGSDRFRRVDKLPPLLRSELARGAQGAAALAGARSSTVTELEQFLELAHAADEEGTAIEEVCAAAIERLRARSVAVIGGPPERRVLACAGKPWNGEPAAGLILAGASGVPVDSSTEPCRAAVPVRCGGELVGALACRYAPGAAVHPERTAEILRGAALAIAPAVRALLERGGATTETDAADIVGDSACMHALRDAVARAARAPFPVLVQGESGSGKELVARAIHRLGPRRGRKFCAINSAALTDDLLEAELFGHTRGAFTGAATERAGLFEDADGGTLFLDEVGELSARAQAKLLRVLQDGEVRRIGENIARRVDVRVVAATNRRLDEEAAAGRFRIDLRFRLDVVRIEVPPLRERAVDVPVLAGRFWREAAARVGSNATLAPSTLAALARYDWPGNVRELQNVIAWMAVHSPQRGRIGPSSLPSHVAGTAPPSSATFEAARREFERRFVRAALAAANGRRGRAADAMGVTRQGLAKILRRLGIEA